MNRFEDLEEIEAQTKFAIELMEAIETGKKEVENIFKEAEDACVFTKIILAILKEEALYIIGLSHHQKHVRLEKLKEAIYSSLDM